MDLKMTECLGAPWTRSYGGAGYKLPNPWGAGAAMKPWVIRIFKIVQVPLLTHVHQALITNVISFLQGYSTSEIPIAVLDFGTNYCNLHNLITGKTWNACLNNYCLNELCGHELLFVLNSGFLFCRCRSWQISQILRKNKWPSVYTVQFT